MLKNKKFWGIVIGVAIIACIIFVIIPAFNGGEAKKYYLTERTRASAIGYGLFYVTTDSYIVLSDTREENGCIAGGKILVHVVYDDGTWNEYDSTFKLQSNSSGGQYYYTFLPWNEFKIKNGEISLLYTSTSGFTYADLTFR
ncbi:MAG: hypothetical protein K2I20_05730 [Clostridia bacterium]|nr:hypothetical protein [Clostridia bacterium]MDE6356662.1 hypothetical protein [Clostridia bacterium]